MSNPEAPVPSQIIPDNKLQPRIFSNFSNQDYVMIGLTGVLVYITYRTVPPLIIIELITFSALMIRFKNGYGRLYREIWLDFKGSYIMKYQGGILWEADNPRFRRKNPFPNLTQISAQIDGVLNRLGMLQQTDRPYDNIFLLSKGGLFANQDASSENQSVHLLTEITNSVILQNSLNLKVGSSFVRITAPFNPYTLSSNLRVKIDPVVAYPQQFNLSKGEYEAAQRQHDNMEMLRQTMQRLGASSNWSLIVLTIKRTADTKIGRRPRRYTNKRLSSLPIVQLGLSMAEDLATNEQLGLSDVHCCGIAELAEIIRAGWDPFGITDLFRDQAQGRAPLNDDDVKNYREQYKDDPNIDDAIDQYLQAYPKRIIKIHEKEKCIQFDDNYAITVRITQLPDTISVTKFRDLQYKLSKHGWIRRSMVGQTVSGNTETNQQLIGQSFAANVNNFRNKDKIVKDPRLSKRLQRKELQTEVLSMQGIAQLFQGLWTAVSSSPEEAEMAAANMVGFLRNFGFNAEVVHKPALMMDASLGGMYGINRF